MAKAKTKPAAAEATEEAPKRGRGRPRPQEVIDRDEVVFAALTEPLAKSEIVEKTGLEPNEVYLSLWRLHKAERIQLGDGERPRVWARVA